MSYTNKTLEELNVLDDFLMNAIVTTPEIGEMFCKTDNRFYQAKIDGRHLKSGEEDFVRLPDLYVITITNYAPFGYDYMMYRIGNCCREIPELNYDDGLEFIYFYTGGHKGGNESIRAMLHYIQKSRKENVVDEATKEINKIVEQIRTLPEVRNEYMTLGDIIDWEREEAAEEAKARQLNFHITNTMKNLHLDLPAACEGLGITEEDYYKAEKVIEEAEAAENGS